MKINIHKLISERITETGEFLKIDEGKCNGCKKCAIVCAMSIWKIKEGKAMPVEDYNEKCLECGACEVVCESNAIDFQYPAGGTGVVYLNG